MNRRTNFLRRVVSSIVLGAFGFLALPANALVINMVVTPLGGSFQYDVSVQNDEAEDLLIVSLLDAPPGDPLIDPSLTSPAGFQASYDGGLGLLDLVSDAGIFAVGTTVGVFRFESLAGPLQAFRAVEGYNDQLQPFSGTVNFVLVSAVPEGGSAGLLMLTALAALRWTQRSANRKNSTRE
jgi:hypothetical protein